MHRTYLKTVGHILQLGKGATLEFSSLIWEGSSDLTPLPLQYIIYINTLKVKVGVGHDNIYLPFVSEVVVLISGNLYILL